MPVVGVKEHASDSGGGGESSSTTYVTVNGGKNSLDSADSVDVSTSVTNISANNVTVYVYGDYNAQHLFSPHITELHMLNNEVGALWNPTLQEIPKTLHAAVMRQASISVLYDGWIDLENRGHNKPFGATREGEILGYDIYAKLGERYQNLNESDPSLRPEYVYQTDGFFAGSDPVNYTWAIMQLYRAMGIEQVRFYAQTEPVLEDYDINTSPILQALTMPVGAPYLEDGITRVAATRTEPDGYLDLARKDGLAVSVPTVRDEQYLTVGEFCVIAAELMHLYGEPVLTEQETYLLLEAYGRDLPYGLADVQLEAVKYLLARGVVTADLTWRDNIDFETATAILMRIKDENSRLTFKEIQLTTDVGLLEKGYYPTTVAAQQSPIEILDEMQEYTRYTEYDYFVQCVDEVVFQSPRGYASTPFICNGASNSYGILDGTSYLGRVWIEGKPFYHFRTLQTKTSVAVDGSVYINTAGDNDAPYMYRLPEPEGGNAGGYWLYTGATTDIPNVVDTWSWHTLDGGEFIFPAEYCDAARKLAATENAETQLSLFSQTTYGFTFRVYKDDLKNVKFTNGAGEDQTLAGLKALTTSSQENTVELANHMRLERNEDAGMYALFTVTGCSNRGTLAEIFTCDNGTAYQSFPAFAQQGNRYLVSIDYLKSIGVVWEFTKTAENSYYLGVKTFSAERNSANSVPLYTDVYIGKSDNSSYVIRGSQLTLYDEDVAVVWETNTGYYVDYSAILGVSRLVSFEHTEGGVTLTRAAGIEGISRTKIYNMNNEYEGTAPHGEWATYATVKNAAGASMPYIYCPISYPLANWLVFDDAEGNKGVFNFFADSNASPESNGAKMLRSMLGVETTGTNWQTYFTPGLPPSAMQVTYKENAYVLGESAPSGWPAMVYIEEYDAYLVRPNIIGESSGFSNYGQFVKMEDKSSLVTSLVARVDAKGAIEYLGDWNYNLYTFRDKSLPPTLVRHGMRDKTNMGYSLQNIYFNMDNYTGSSSQVQGESMGAQRYYTDWTDWIAAPAGVPGLLGYPATTNWSLFERKGIYTYSGSAYMVRGDGQDYPLAMTSNGEEDSSQKLLFSVIHATPTTAWTQSCGFKFTFLVGSPLGEPTVAAPTFNIGGALAGFDWDQFFKDIGLQNADDWLTIAIIAVLNLLPRVFMFAFIVLMGLALIANVKPWQLFCDNVFDPYKALTLGRKDVHTIQLKMVFLYSMIALALFGMFQNGLILNVIAWIARAVTGILVR